MRAIQKEYVERLQVTCWEDVLQHLRSLTGRGGSAARDPIDWAVRFYRGVLAAEFPRGSPLALQELLAIDFHSDVESIRLPAGQTLQTYALCEPSLGTERPHERRVLRDRLDPSRLVMPRLGAFFTNVGVGADRLGLYLGRRRCVRVRLNVAVDALRSRASGVVDAWTDRPVWSRNAGTPHMAGGGGVQYRVPRCAIQDRDALVIV